MKDLYDSPTLRALRALDESPTMKAIRAIEDSPVARMVREMNNSCALRALRDLEDSPAMQTIRQLEESPVMRIIRDLENSPALRAVREIEESPAFEAIRRIQDSPAIRAIQALERHPVLEAFSTVADRIASGYGALTFAEAYDLLANEYDHQLNERAAEPLDGLAASVKHRAAHAPSSALSAEFYLSLIFSLFLFYLSQMSAEQSEERIMQRMDEMEQTISSQLDTLRDQTHEVTFLVADRSVNLRAGPSTEHEVLDVLRRNQKVRQLEASNEWAKVEYFDYVANEEKQGWVHMRYFIVLLVGNG